VLCFFGFGSWSLGVWGLSSMGLRFLFYWGCGGGCDGGVVLGWLRMVSWGGGGSKDGLGLFWALADPPGTCMCLGCP
jgi:hypothetical protein